MDSSDNIQQDGNDNDDLQLYEQYMSTDDDHPCRSDKELIVRLLKIVHRHTAVDTNNSVHDSNITKILKKASKTVRNDRDVIILAVSMDHRSMFVASTHLQNDLEIATMVALMCPYDAFRFVGDIPFDNREFVMTVVKGIDQHGEYRWNRTILSGLHPKFVQDPEILILVLSKANTHFQLGIKHFWKCRNYGCRPAHEYLQTLSDRLLSRGDTTLNDLLLEGPTVDILDDDKKAGEETPPPAFSAQSWIRPTHEIMFLIGRLGNAYVGDNAWMGLSVVPLLKNTQTLAGGDNDDKGEDCTNKQTKDDNQSSSVHRSIIAFAGLDLHVKYYVELSKWEPVILTLVEHGLTLGIDSDLEVEDFHPEDPPGSLFDNAQSDY